MNTVDVRRLRLGAAFVLLTYLTLHFANHALGLVSLATMEAGRWWFLALWRSAPGTLALYGAFTVHGGLALWLLYRRGSLRMPVWEAMQYGLGLALPALLAGHVVATRIAWWRLDADDPYARIVLALWVLAPPRGIWQAVTVVIAWLHGCIGLHYWLRLRPWYPRAAPWLLSLALLLPVLALLGFVAAGREVAALARTPGWVDTLLRETHAQRPSESAVLVTIRETFLNAYLCALVAVLAARGVRRIVRRRGAIQITYPDGRVVPVARGLTILEASRRGGIRHASVCGGRGRCSTCRVRVVNGQANLPAPRDIERRVLARVGAAPDVRLACQTRPIGDVTVRLLVAPTVQAPDAAGPDGRQGRERELVVLFADLRGFTRMAEHKLPYDVVYLLNRYFATVGGAITAAGGIANQFTGDGVMALFGVDDDAAVACRRALAAARAMAEGVAALGRELAPDLATPMRIGIGIHVGPGVVGWMGWGESFYLTAVGDTVHVAARLEQATKDYDCELVISEDVATRAGLDAASLPRHEIALRNRATPVVVRVVARAGDLAS